MKIVLLLWWEFFSNFKGNKMKNQKNIFECQISSKFIEIFQKFLIFSFL